MRGNRCTLTVSKIQMSPDVVGEEADGANADVLPGVGPIDRGLSRFPAECGASGHTRLTSKRHKSWLPAIRKVFTARYRRFERGIRAGERFAPQRRRGGFSCLAEAWLFSWSQWDWSW
jgi:hypothetical protein